MAFWLAILLLVVLYRIFRLIYELRFHPLSLYPGPRTWIVSRIPYLLCMNAGKLPFRIKELHDQYGPIVRLSADELSINDPRAWKDIYSRKDMLRPPQWGSRPPGVDAHSVISAPAPDHARFRKAFNPLFSEKATRSYEPFIRSYFDRLFVHFDDKISSNGTYAIIDLVHWVNFTTFDVIGEIATGKGYGCLETGTGYTFMGVLLHFQAFLIGTSIKYYPWLDVFLAIITPRSTFRILEDIFQDTRRRMRDRMNTKATQHPDLMGYLQEYNHKAGIHERLSEDEVLQNLLAIIVGGSETLTTTFSGVFHHILADQTLYDRLVKEVRSTFASTAEITASSAAFLPYLNAVIEETLRVCPPIPDALRRQVPAAGATIAGRRIPPGTTVSVSCYSMFKSANIFENPGAFIPERWLKGLEIPSFYPFALGPHNCLGQPLARLEMRLLLALLVFRYDFKVPMDAPLKRWTDQKIYWTWAKQPLIVEISHARS